MRKLRIWFLASLALTGFLSVSAEDLDASASTRIHPALQKRLPKSDADKSGSKLSMPGRKFLDRTTVQQTTESPTTTTYTNPQIRTHTIVRSQPVYIPFSTESPIEIGETISSKSPSDESYYYTYDEDSADDKVTAEAANPVAVTTTSSTTRATPTRNFWKSPKASDIRKKAQRNIFGYNRQVGSSKATTTTMAPTTTTTTTTTTVLPVEEKKTTAAEVQHETHPINKTVKGNSIEINLAEQKVSTTKLDPKIEQKFPALMGSVGRIGEYPFQPQLVPQGQQPYQSGQVVPQGQLQIQPGNSGLGPRSSKFDASIGNVRYMDNLNGGVQQQLLNNNRNILNTNTNNLANGNAFIQAIPPSNNGGRGVNAPASSAGNTQQNNFVPRTGQYGSGGSGGGGLGGLGLKLPGLGGSGTGFTLNLGPVPDPISFILRLLASIPRPLFNLNSRLIFGIELGNNVGLTSGVGAGKYPGKK